MDSKQLLLRNMHTFNVAAKNMSFKLTADELHLTQSAVSHRIKSLEKELGFNLFIRGTRKLSLSPEGERLYATLSRSLSTIFNEIDSIQSSDLTGELRIIAAPSFARKWLIPRLNEFQKSFPQLNLELRVTEDTLDLSAQEFDIAFYYGDYEQPNIYSMPLFEDKYIPVCSPEYARKHQIIERGYDALKEINFLHSTSSTAWQRWLNSVNCELDCNKRSYKFSQHGLAVEAAKFSVGMAIGRQRFVAEDLRAGKLLAPFPSLDTNQHYALLCTKGMQERPKIAAFIQWIKSELEM